MIVIIIIITLTVRLEYILCVVKIHDLPQKSPNSPIERRAASTAVFCLSVAYFRYLLSLVTIAATTFCVASQLLYNFLNT